MSNPTPETTKEEIATPTQKGILHNPWAKLGVAFLAGAILTAGIGSLAINKNNSNPNAGNAQAKSANTWHQFAEKLPDGWTATDLGLSNDPLLNARSDLMAVNDANKCTYNITESYLEPAEFKNTPAEYLATSQVLGYGQFRDATNATLDNKAFNTSEGKVNFVGATYELKYDLDGDGKDNNVKEAHYAHAYTEAPTEEGTIPLTEIGYVCPSAGDWSADTFNKLAEATILNISGDDAPVKTKEDDTNANATQPASDPLPSVDDAGDDKKKDDKKKDDKKKEDKE